MTDELLPDDLINSFCDKLQLAYGYEIEGMFSMQYLKVENTADVQARITGQNPVAQILLDSSRAHYILLFYNSDKNFIAIYDSLQRFDADGNPIVSENVCKQVSVMFGQIFERQIPCTVDINYEQQTDGYSCGYRAIGALVDLARRRNPCTSTIRISAIRDLLDTVLRTASSRKSLFQSAEIGSKKSISGSNCMWFSIPNISI